MDSDNDLNEKSYKISSQKCKPNNNQTIEPTSERKRLTDEQANLIRAKWESRNFNDFNAWIQKTQSVLSVSVVETIKSTKYKTRLTLTNIHGLFENVIQTEGDGYSKKESKTNAMRVMMNILIDKDLLSPEDVNSSNGISQINESEDKKIKNLIKLLSGVNNSNEKDCITGLQDLYKMKKDKINWTDIAPFWFYCIQEGKSDLLNTIITTLFDQTDISLQIKDEMINSLIFSVTSIHEWGDLNKIINTYFDNVSYHNDQILCDKYFKYFKKMYHVELLESLQMATINILNEQSPSTQKIYCYGQTSSNGARFSQEIITFTPNMNAIYITKSATSKEKSISEEEIVLIEQPGQEKQIGFISSITVTDTTTSVKIRKCFETKKTNTNDKDNFLQIQQGQDNYKITKLMNSFVYNKTFAGLRSFCINPSSLKTSSSSSNGNSQSLHVDQKIRQIITNSYEKTSSLEEIESLCNETIFTLPKNFKVANYLLNESQQQAIISSLSRRLTIIQGPPGTGKTSTCVEIVLEWLRLNPYGLMMSKLLVTAESNCAVDILYRELLIANVDVFRYSYKENMAQDYAQIKSKINSARVICATCVGSANEYLRAFSFPFVIIDESTQATELSTLIPLLHNCKQLTLIGDHKQLPPTILSPVANKQGLGTSLFERLINFGIKPHLLNKQYRMHSSLYQFPSETFYDGYIMNGIEDSARPQINGINWPSPNFRLGFIDIKGKEEIEPNSHSYYNSIEVNFVMTLLVSVLNQSTLSPISIGIITPYDAQKRMIRKTITNAYSELPESIVIVDTVDGFQGMERDLIVFSFVRSNSGGKIGFVNDSRRINVILTRARKGLVVIGNSECMKGNKIWKKWISFIDENNLNIKF